MNAMLYLLTLVLEDLDEGLGEYEKVPSSKI